RSLLAVTTASLLLLLHACGQDPTEPPGFTPGETYQLTVGTGSSSASGVVTSNRGGIDCSITGSTGGAAASGTCTGTYAAGTVVSVTATAVGGAVLKLDSEWGATCTPLVEAPQVCQITMDRDRAVAATFVPAPTTFTLTVAGGASGSGTVHSIPAGISCTIADGQAVSGNCSAGFPRGASVKLTATATGGRGIKAWAGGQCQAEGGWKSVGSCVTTMSRNVSVVVSFESLAAALDAGTMGEWTAPFSWGAVPAVAINAALLPNRQVVTYGRHHRQPVLWNPANPGTFTSLPLPADFFCSGLTLLRNGKLFVAGGHAGVDNFGLKVAYQFNQSTLQWIRSADMQNGRWYPTLTTMGNGQILAISGGDTASALNRIPEVFIPAQNRWRALPGAARIVPYYPMMFYAPDGKIFMAGPEQSTAFLTTTGSGVWTTGPTRINGSRDYGSGVMYDVGKILVVGGGSPTATAERIDLLGTLEWTPAGVMSVPRRQINATLLADGTVLVTGGTNASGFNSAPTSSSVLAAELWNPASPSEWKQLASMSHYRLYHTTALLLPDGRVAVMGSGEPAATGLTDDPTAEIFSPPYLFNADGTPATRPVISSAPAKLTYGTTFTVVTASAAQITKVLFVRLSTVTHATDMNQRGVVLSYSIGAGSLTVTAPATNKLAPPGHYMLFIVNSSGVPSVAKIVRFP
ncbi:MAG: galactose oxidase-like domain-containing protein, partial [Gemmatimonadales bacterium]